nr:ATP-binding protein [Fodinibius sp.]
TDITTQVCNEIDYELMVCHPIISDPVDFKGMPWITKNGNGESEADFIPFNDLKRMITADKPLVVFFDDLGQAPPAVQASIMQLLLARRIGEHKVSDQVSMIAATNGKKHKAGVKGILEPVKSRFVTIVELIFDEDAWFDWAMNEGLDYKLIAFGRFKTELLCAFIPTADMINSPVPRTVHNLDKLIKLDLPEVTQYPIYAGAVGEGFTKEFMAFLRLYDNLPNLHLLDTDPDAVEVPTKADIRYAVVSALINRITDQNFKNIMQYISRFPIEFQAVFIHDVKKMKPEYQETKPFVDWCVRNGDKHL